MKLMSWRFYALYLISFSIKLISKITLFYDSNVFKKITIFLLWIKSKIISKKIKKYIFRANPSEICHSISQNDNNVIWVLWMQGYDNAPVIVKKCIDSIIHNSGGFKVQVLDENNIMDFVYLPDFILDKYKSGIISNTHLSDIIRAYLLSEYGGFWIDATVYLTKKLDKMDYSFFTLKDRQNNKSVSSGMWAGYFMYSDKNHPLMRSLYNSFLNYWSKESNLIDYFLIDYILKLLIMDDEVYAKYVEKLPVNGSDRFFLKSILNNPVTYESSNKISKTNGVFKLTYKEKFIRESQGVPTYYQLIINGDLYNKVEL